MSIYDPEFRREHTPLLTQMAEVVATAMRERLAGTIERDDLDELYVEVNVRYARRGNIKILTADSDLMTAVARETEPIASRKAPLESVR